MKSAIYSITGEKTSEIDLPFQFSEPIREDLVKRAVLAVRSAMRQPYGTDPLAGTKQGRPTKKRRKAYGTSYGIGMTRIKQKALWKRGRRFGWVSAFVANALKGRAAFPPVAERIFEEKINRKEKWKAVRSAIAATAIKELVERKNTVYGIKSIPLIVEDKFESLKKTKEVVAALEKLGLQKELERISERTIRAGKGKMRGRKYRTRCGPLIIVSKACSLENAASNLLGVDVVQVKNLNAYLLAPSASPGRLAIWTKGAIETLTKEKLFS